MMKRSNLTGSRPGVAPSATGGSGQWPIGAVFVLILFASLVAYFPALAGDFLWDDAGHVTSPILQPWSGLLRIWFEPGATQQYYPLLHTAFWIEHQVWGDATAGYHLINVLWHAASACLLVAILRRLAIPGSLLAGLLFALHPVCVESVAWISEQKNTLSTVFCLAAVLAWLRFRSESESEGESGAEGGALDRPESAGKSQFHPSAKRAYAIASLWFVAALLTKTVTATLPAALLVIAWWRRGRMSWRGDVMPLLPWLVLGVLAGLGTAWFESTGIGATGEEFALGPVERGLLAGRVVWFYLGKLLWPAGLMFFYPRWAIDATEAWQWLFPGAALLVLAGLVWWRKRDRAPLAAALLFGGTLFPVLGFVNVYPFVFSFVADHFQYLACIAVIAFLAAAATRGFALLGWPRGSGHAIATGVLLILGVLTWRQSGMYRDVFILYEATLDRNPSSWAAHLNLGTALADAGHPAEGLPHLRRATELKPDFPEALNSLADTMNRLGLSRDALPLVDRALQIQPRFAEAHNTRGVASMALGRVEEGIEAFRRALDLNPKLAGVRVNLGWALANQGRFPEAIAEFETARRLHPDFADSEFKWGLVFAMQRRFSEAVPHLARAVELQPDNAEMRFILGSALVEVRRRAEAEAQFEHALRLNPDHAGARAALDNLRRMGRPQP